MPVFDHFSLCEQTDKPGYVVEWSSV